MKYREMKMAMAFNAFSYYLVGYQKALEDTDGWMQKSAREVFSDINAIISEMWDEIDENTKEEN